MIPARLQGTELFAWIGEDELGSGEIGLKQGLVPAGMIPLVAIDRKKITQTQLLASMNAQAKNSGKRIYLARFVLTEVWLETANGESL